MVKIKGKVSNKRLRIWKQAKGLCTYCGIQTFLDEVCHHPQFATIDHMLPVSTGGPDVVLNKVLACFKCNQEKKTTPIQEFLELQTPPSEELIAAYFARKAKCWFCEKETILWWFENTVHKAFLTHGHLSCRVCHRRFKDMTIQEAVFGEGMYY